MIKRIYWLNKIEESWRERSIVWLSGVRRSGKTILSRSLSSIEYYDCELPQVRSMSQLRQNGEYEILTMKV